MLLFGTGSRRVRVVISCWFSKISLASRVTLTGTLAATLGRSEDAYLELRCLSLSNSRRSARRRSRTCVALQRATFFPPVLHLVHLRSAVINLSHSSDSFRELRKKKKRAPAPPCLEHSWSAVGNPSPRQGRGAKKRTSGPDDRYRVAGKRALALGGARSQGKGRIK